MASKTAKSETGANLGFEAKLFLTADKLRGSMDASEYKHVALGLVFLKYISDAFNTVFEKLQADEYADQEDAEEYLAERTFWVPKEARWGHLQANAKQPTIGKLVDDAMLAIEKSNASLKGVLPTNYAREALRQGLALEAQGITNPYSFGLIGSSDTHTGAAQNDESNFLSKLGVLSADGSMRGSVPLGLIESTALNFLPGQDVAEIGGEDFLDSQQTEFGASGLAGVWAEENTRQAIYAAFRRKETFATSGPRIRLRFFAGYNLPNDLLETADGVAQAYANGVTMGAELAPNTLDRERSPSFAIWAQADANSAPLQRLQIVKGWIDTAGETHEHVIDVACAGGLEVNPDTNRCPDNDAVVSLSDCSYSANTGDAQLRTVWTDPKFKASERAFYYTRALENPTCRWNTWDAIRAGTVPRADLAATLQERAWSSPIHYVP